MTTNTLFRSVDVASFVTTFVDKLRVAGIEVGLTATNRCVEALACCPPTDLGSLYWVLRTSLVHDVRDLEAFEAVFAAVFHSDGLPIERDRRKTGSARVEMTGTLLKQSAPSDGFEIMRGRVETSRRPEIVDDGNADDGTDDSVVRELVPSAMSSLADTPFDELSIDDLDMIGRWLEQQVLSFPCRPTRRYRAANRPGVVDLRRTLLHARRTGGQPIRIAYRKPRVRPRKLVMIADVSGSMESFTRIYLHLMRALVIMILTRV